MRIVRYRVGDRAVLGVWGEEWVINLTDLNPRVFDSFLHLIQHAHRVRRTIEELVSKAMEGAKRRKRERLTERDERLLIPLNPPEVWACGVTYRRSREAREYESGVKGIYDLVYEAERPEIFFKTTGLRCVGPNQPIGVRGDSNWSVPEPELAFILGADQRIVAFTAGNDVTARDIEGENPLYLPQAKTFEGCCALGPSILTFDEVGPEPKLEIRCEVIRGGEVVFQGSTNTSRMKRSLEELRSYLCRYNPIPPGTVCLTGTGIVPPDDFALEDGDVVRITIEKIGTLINPVKRLI